MSVLVSALLGLVQGITEFLPVSSSGHLSIIQNLLGVEYSEEEHLLFDVLLHVATLVSICIAYKSELKVMVKDCADVLTGKTATTEEGGRLKPSVRNVILIIVATLPLIVVLFFNSRIESLFYNTTFIAFSLIITGCLVFASTKFADGRKNARTATVMDALAVGAAQAIATIPGVSRSGATITVGLSRGFKRSYAVQFSFILSIPAVFFSAVVSFYRAVRAGIVWANIPVYLVGMIIAGVVGYFAIMAVRRLLLSDKFRWFAYYCWVIGLVVFIISIVK